MKELYLDIMEKSLSAYTPERIRDYIDDVRENKLKEHGFPRLGANIGILIVNGRRTDLLPLFVEIMDLCCFYMPAKRAANDFSIREVCCCLMLLEGKGIVSEELLAKWKEQIASFDPWTRYSQVDDNSGKFVANWAMFAAVSEYIRGKYCSIDTSEFVEHQLPSQLANLDENDMYMDEPPYENHVLYDLVPRVLMAFLLHAGYQGKYASQLAEVLDNTAQLTLEMQSVTGETAFGGRSNQFIHNEALLVSYFEMEATRFARKGDLEMAGKMKAAAAMAAASVQQYLSLEPISHVKNRYDISSMIGCESYGYFNKYMITVASNVYMGYLFADDSIAPTVAPAQAGGYVRTLSKRFRLSFLNHSGYVLEWNTDADPHYDANGLGRVHKSGCPAALCLSVPFARKPAYTLEGENPSAMSLCCYATDGERKLLGAELYAEHTLLRAQSGEETAEAVFAVKLSRNMVVTQTYTVSKNGVDITLTGDATAGFMLPVFEFDGQEHTEIWLEENMISVRYHGAVCRYRFAGKLEENYRLYYNRNGRYRVYSIASKTLHIEMEEAHA